MRRLPVDSSRPSLSRKSVMPSSSSSSSTRSRRVGLGFGDERQVQRGADRVPHLEVPLERERDGLGHGQRREQPAVLERAAEAEAGAHGRRQLRDVDRVVALAER